MSRAVQLSFRLPNRNPYWWSLGVSNGGYKVSPEPRDRDFHGYDMVVFLLKNGWPKSTGLPQGEIIRNLEGLYIITFINFYKW